MRTVLVFAFLAAVVSPALGKPTAGNETVAQEQRDNSNTNITSDIQVVGKVIVSKRNARYGGCLRNKEAKIEVQKNVEFCNTGYARHRNGRCYRVVDKPRDGRPIAKHEYQITSGTECYVFDPERNVSDLSKEETLDLCDEDGGCDKYVRIQPAVPRRRKNGHSNK